MKKYILLLAVLIALSGTAYAAELTNPEVIWSGETFIVHSGDSLIINENEYLNVIGTLIVESGSTLYNYGSITNQGTIDSTAGNIINEGTIYNYPRGSLSGWVNGVFVNTKIITNPGTIQSGDVLIVHDYEVLTIPYDETLVIEAGGKLIVESSGSISGIIENSGFIENSGIITEGSITSIINSGTVNNYGHIQGAINNSGIINNYKSFDLQASASSNSGTINNSGGIHTQAIMHNTGSIINSGELNALDGIMDNSGTIYTSGKIDGLWAIINSGYFDNSGTISIWSGSSSNFGTFNNSGIFELNSHLGNYGTIDNYGTISVDYYTHLYNEGIINNFGNLFEVYFDDFELINNYGTINNCTTGIITLRINGNPVNTVTCTGENVPVTSITVTGASTTVENGQTLQMTATVNPATATNKGVTWSVVAGTGAATITQDGLLTGTKAGTVTVKATTKDGSGMEGSLVVTVTEIPPTVIPVTGVELSAAATTVEVGKTLQMTVTVNPTTATNKDVTWSVVAGAGNATITQSGLLTATKAGTVTVKATSKDGSGVQGSLLITITTVPVTVIPVTGIALSEATTTVENGKTLQMTATVYPENATNKNVLWSVESITGDAVISETGLLTGKAVGNVTVKVTSVANSNVKDSLNITVTAAKTASSKSGGGGSGSGGSGSSGEKQGNIAFKDVKSAFVQKDILASYKFEDEENPIGYINFTASRNWGQISSTIEVLHNTSSLVKQKPIGIVYSNVNIWVGKSAFSNPENINNPVIGFKVRKDWIAQNSIDESTIRLCRYSDNKWNNLQTIKINEDENSVYYEAATTGFSPFSIVGDSLETSSQGETVESSLTSLQDATLEENNAPVEQKNTKNEWIIIGFLFVVTAGGFLIYRKKKG